MLLPYLYKIDLNRRYSNHGPLVIEFQKRLAALFGLPQGQVVSASSGTAALEAAILAVAGKARAERPYALCPSYTFVATGLAIERCGYIPYFVDIDPITLQLEPAQLERHALLSKTGVVVTVGAYGMAPQVVPWEQFQANTGVPVVVDGAACVEALSRAPSESLSAIPLVLSLHATKPLSTGEGGAVVTRSSEVAQKCAQHLNFGFGLGRECEAAGFNGKMSEYNAAVGLASLDLWKSTIENSARVVASYNDHFRAEGLASLLRTAPRIASSYFLIDAGSRAVALRQKLERERIESRLWYGLGLHRYRYFETLRRDELPITDAIAPVMVGLPTAPDFSSQDIAHVVRSVSSVFGVV